MNFDRKVQFVVQTYLFTLLYIPIKYSVFSYNFSDDIRQKMMSKYLNNPDYNFEKVNRASQACGPMVKWAIAQVSLNMYSYEFT